MKIRLKGIAVKLVDMIFPPVCPVCNEIVTGGGRGICPGCEAKLTYTGDCVCLKCGKPVDEDEEYCSDCLRIAHEYNEGRAALVYDEITSKSIYRFKYNHKREYAAVYGRIMEERLGKKIKSWDVDAIIPVPVHKSRLRKRGYNQAQLIADELSKRLSIPVCNTLVTRSAATKVQKELGALERQNNLKKAFNVMANDVKYNSVLIVDDIYTTGATVDAMARCLKGVGIQNVYFVSLCIGRGT